MGFVDARITSDLDDVLAKFEGTVQEKVLVSGAAGMARVIYDEVKLNAAPPRLGRKTGNLERSIYRAFSPERSTAESKVYRISWNKRTAPHGHLVEFGTARAPAHPFLRPALDHMEQAIKEGRARMAARLKEES